MKDRVILIAFLGVICLNEISANDYLLFEPNIAGKGFREADWGIGALLGLHPKGC